jgi:hypothetical protein
VNNCASFPITSSSYESMKTTINKNTQYGNNLYGLSRVRNAYTIQRVTVLLFSLNVILSIYSLLLISWNLSISISIWMCIIGNVFQYSLKNGSPCRMSRIRFKSVLLHNDRTWTLQRTFFLQHNYAADIKKICKKDKLWTVETHIWESDVHGDKLRDEFAAGVRDAVIWSKLTFTVCYFNPSNGKFSAAVDHVRRAELQCVVLCCRLSRQPACTDTTVRIIDWILKNDIRHCIRCGNKLPKHVPSIWFELL